MIARPDHGYTIPSYTSGDGSRSGSVKKRRQGGDIQQRGPIRSDLSFVEGRRGVEFALRRPGDYSSRSASTGSTRVARRAGM